MSVEHMELSESQKQEHRKFRHELIGEFREALTNTRYEIPEDTDAFIVLSAAPDLSQKDNEKLREQSPENISRVALGAELLRELTARKINKPVEKLSIEDLRDPIIPSFILNGEPEQLPYLEELAELEGIPKEKIRLIDCGPRGVGNTKTQFEAIMKDTPLAGARHLTIITQSYHAPRVERTASSILPPMLNFDIVGVPLSELDINVYRKVKGEVQRIMEYSEKGDIARSTRATS